MVAVGPQGTASVEWSLFARQQWIVSIELPSPGFEARPGSSENIEQGRMKRSRRSLRKQGSSIVWVVTGAWRSFFKAGGYGDKRHLFPGLEIGRRDPPRHIVTRHSEA